MLDVAVWAKFIGNVGVIRIPKSLLKENQDPELTELHVFRKASGNGYGAVAYA